MSTVDQAQEIATAVVARIAQVAQDIAWQAGVGGMETAGSIVSFLARNPEHVADFMDRDGAVMDWPIGWHTHGCLSWHAQDGKVVTPEHARRAVTVRRLLQEGRK